MASDRLDAVARVEARAEALGLSREERRSAAANQMTAQGLTLLVECYMIGTDVSHAAPPARRAAANFLIREGLISFIDVQVPGNGFRVTERGRQHVERLLALPVLKAPQQGAQNGAGEAAPRFVWGYALDAPGVPIAAPVSAAEALGLMAENNPTLSNPIASSIFLEALTWDQQARVLERMGWRRVP